MSNQLSPYQPSPWKQSPITYIYKEMHNVPHSLDAIIQQNILNIHFYSFYIKELCMSVPVIWKKQAFRVQEID